MTISLMVFDRQPLRGRYPLHMRSSRETGAGEGSCRCFEKKSVSSQDGKIESIDYLSAVSSTVDFGDLAKLHFPSLYCLYSPRVYKK